jgi:hypothetical protein
MKGYFLARSFVSPNFHIVFGFLGGCAHLPFCSDFVCQCWGVFGIIFSVCKSLLDDAFPFTLASPIFHLVFGDSGECACQAFVLTLFDDA